MKVRLLFSEPKLSSLSTVHQESNLWPTCPGRMVRATPRNQDQINKMKTAVTNVYFEVKKGDCFESRSWWNWNDPSQRTRFKRPRGVMSRIFVFLSGEKDRILAIILVFFFPYLSINARNLKIPVLLFFRCSNILLICETAFGTFEKKRGLSTTKWKLFERGIQTLF